MFGEYIRALREQENMPLRKLAALLDIDQSTLSKIERGERQPTRNMIPVLASTFRLKEKDLAIYFLKEQLTYQLQDEEYSLEALKAAEQEIRYRKNKK